MENKNHKVGLIVVSTGQYTKYLDQFITTFKKFFFEGQADLYIFTDKDIKQEDNIKVIPVKHLGWPVMPLLQAELVNKYRHILKNKYLFLIDGDVYFNRHVRDEILSPLTAVLHRNIERKREAFNYETRLESTAAILPNEGDKYFIGGLYGGERIEFFSMIDEISNNIRIDIEKGIREFGEMKAMLIDILLIIFLK